MVGITKMSQCEQNQKEGGGKDRVREKQIDEINGWVKGQRDAALQVKYLAESIDSREDEKGGISERLAEIGVIDARIVGDTNIALFTFAPIKIPQELKDVNGNLDTSCGFQEWSKVIDIGNKHLVHYMSPSRITEVSKIVRNVEKWICLQGDNYVALLQQGGTRLYEELLHMCITGTGKHVDSISFSVPVVLSSNNSRIRKLILQTEKQEKEEEKGWLRKLPGRIIRGLSR
jgi:hypothetical protein